MPRLFLHIGQPKTATTTIQNYLLTNRDVLARNGWLYPRAILQGTAHHPLGNFFDVPQHWIVSADPEACKRDLLYEIATTGCENVILSTESLFFIRKVERAAEYFRGFDTRIVATLRRQDEWIESAFRDMTKTGDWIGGPYKFYEAKSYALDYPSILDRWAAAFGRENIIVDVFEKSASRLPVEERFLQKIGVQVDWPMAPVPSANETLSRDAIAFYAQFRERPRVDLRHNIFQTLLVEYSARFPDPPEARHFLAPDFRAKIVADSAEQNRQIAATYLSDGREQLFAGPPPDPGAEWVPYTGLTMQKSVHIAEFLVNRLYAMKHAVAG